MTDDTTFGFLGESQGDKLLGKGADAPVESGGEVVGGREIQEYEVVRLVSDKYQDIGLAKGEVGTVVDIIPAKIPGYTVEFHEIDLSSPAGIKTFRREEIELVEDGDE